MITIPEVSLKDIEDISWILVSCFVNIQLRLQSSRYCQGVSVMLVLLSYCRHSDRYLQQRTA